MIFFIDLWYSLNSRYPCATIKIVKSRLNYTEVLVSATFMIHGGTPFKKISLHAMKSRHLWNAGSISKTRPSIVTTSRNLLRMEKVRQSSKFATTKTRKVAHQISKSISIYLLHLQRRTAWKWSEGLEQNEIQFTGQLLLLCKSQSRFDDNSVAWFDLWRRMNVFA